MVFLISFNRGLKCQTHFYKGKLGKSCLNSVKWDASFRCSPSPYSPNGKDIMSIVKFCQNSSIFNRGYHTYEFERYFKMTVVSLNGLFECDVIFSQKHFTLRDYASNNDQL